MILELHCLMLLVEIQIPQELGLALSDIYLQIIWVYLTPMMLHYQFLVREPMFTPHLVLVHVQQPIRQL